MIRKVVQDGREYFFVADSEGKPLSFGYRTREEADKVQSLLETGGSNSTLPLGVKIDVNQVSEQA